MVEVVSALAAHSLALFSDAGHILTDVFALGLAWFALQQARRPADERRTYGYHRVGILAAMLNAATLIAVVFGIGYEALRRLQHPEPVQGGLVIVAALLAITVNGFIALSLRGSGNNLNVRAAHIHVMGDLAASIGVVFAGCVILLTGWLPADPLISVGIAVLIAWGAIRILLDTLNILLEGVPTGTDLESVRGLITGTTGIDSVHDLHVWCLAPGQVALSCHVVVSETGLADGEHIVRDLEQKLCGHFGITHTTIQVEGCHPCGEILHGVGDHNHPHPHGHGHLGQGPG